MGKSVFNLGQALSGKKVVTINDEEVCDFGYNGNDKVPTRFFSAKLNGEPIWVDDHGVYIKAFGTENMTKQAVMETIKLLTEVKYYNRYVFMAAWSEPHKMTLSDAKEFIKSHTKAEFDVEFDVEIIGSDGKVLV